MFFDSLDGPAIRKSLPRDEPVELQQKAFLERRDCEAFLSTVGELHDRWRVEVFAY